MDFDGFYHNLDNLTPAINRVMMNTSLPQPLRDKLAAPCLVIKSSLQHESISQQDLAVILDHIEHLEGIIVDYLSLGQY
jgi:hypothetical protein